MSALFLERFQPAVSKQMKISEAFDLTNRTASRGDGRPARKRILGRPAGVAESLGFGEHWLDLP